MREIFFTANLPGNRQDYPRVCGNDVEFVKSLYLKPGSPTHVREELYKSCVVWNTVGITPACAGRTVEYSFKGRIDRDHPRVCGKDHDCKNRSRVSGGSPPRVREGLIPSTVAINPNRITPACAGRTKIDCL